MKWNIAVRSAAIKRKERNWELIWIVEWLTPTKEFILIPIEQCGSRCHHFIHQTIKFNCFMRWIDWLQRTERNLLKERMKWFLKQMMEWSEAVAGSTALIHFFIRFSLSEINYTAFAASHSHFTSISFQFAWGIENEMSEMEWSSARVKIHLIHKSTINSFHQFIIYLFHEITFNILL